MKIKLFTFLILGWVGVAQAEELVVPEGFPPPPAGSEVIKEGHTWIARDDQGRTVWQLDGADSSTSYIEVYTYSYYDSGRKSKEERWVQKPEEDDEPYVQNHYDYADGDYSYKGEVYSSFAGFSHWNNNNPYATVQVDQHEKFVMDYGVWQIENENNYELTGSRYMSHSNVHNIASTIPSPHGGMGVVNQVENTSTADWSFVSYASFADPFNQIVTWERGVENLDPFNDGPPHDDEGLGADLDLILGSTDGDDSEE